MRAVLESFTTICAVGEGGGMEKTMNAKTIGKTFSLPRFHVLSVVAALLVAVFATIGGVQAAYAADAQLAAAQGLATQGVATVDSVQVTLTPPKVGEKGTSDVINLEIGEVDKNTSVSIAVPAGAKYFVEAYAFCEKSQADLSSAVTFEAGKTYYLWITLEGADDIDFNEAALQASVSGGTLAGTPDVYNGTEDGFAYSGANLLVSFQPAQAAQAQVITAANKTVQVKKTVKLGAKTSADGALSYASSNTAVATVSAKGVVTGKKAGKAKITVTAGATDAYNKATKTVTVTVKNANKLATKACSKTLALKTLKKKALAFKPTVIKTKGQGTITYSCKSVTRKYSKYVKVTSAGKVTVKKGPPKGKCVLVLNVKAAGTSSYMPATKTAKTIIKIA